jgi:octaprenyl-diphosphate synthase
MKNLAELKSSVAQELKQVEKLLLKFLPSTPQILSCSGKKAIKHGKKIRPLLILLIGKLSGRVTRQHIFLAAAIEYIHIASLMHDDVIDQEPIRYAPSNINHRNSAILLGDLFYTIGFGLLLKLPPLVVNIILTTTQEMAKGELLNLAAPTDLATYLQIIKLKTALLFANSLKCASILNKKNLPTPQTAFNLGFNFGILYQCIDDLCDYKQTNTKIQITNLINTYTKKTIFTLKSIKPSKFKTVLCDLVLWITQNGV